MRPTLVVAAAISLSGISSAQAQRPFRLGATYSSPSLQDLSGATHSFSSLGGSIAFMTGDEGETGVTISRYHDLSTDGRARQLTLFGLDSYYYPVGARGVAAPFAGTALGLARVTEAKPGCLLLCGDTVSTTSQLALAFGLGVRVNVGDAAVAGVRFRRDTKKAGTVGLEIDYAPLEVTAGSCAPGCRPNAILFAPGYEASVRPAWGRVYGVVGFLLAGFYTEGLDRGMAQGAHGGVGADFYSGRAMWNLNARVLWLQRNSRENVFGVQVGVSVSPTLGGTGRQGRQ